MPTSTPRAAAVGERQAHGAVGQALAQDVAVAVDADEHDRDGDVVASRSLATTHGCGRSAGHAPPRDDAQRVADLAEHRVGDAARAAGRERRRGGEQEREHGDERDVVDRGLAALRACGRMPPRLPGSALRNYTRCVTKNPNFVPRIMREPGSAHVRAPGARLVGGDDRSISSAWARPTSRQPPAIRRPASQPPPPDAELAGRRRTPPPARAARAAASTAPSARR